MTKEDDILYEIDDLKEELKKIEAQQQKILEEETLIKNQTGAVLAQENRVEKKLTRMKFSDITSWKSAIWENCQYKETRTSEITISYWCTKMNAPCKYEDCPLNQL